MSTRGIDSLLADLVAEGTVESEGAFTLDRDKAREKMRQFQLADPLEYLLQLVRAAVLRGATALAFEIDTDDMWLAFDGDPFAIEDFDELYGALFGRGEGGALAARRHLALGVNSALALDPRHVRVESGAAVLEARPGADDAFGPLEPARADTRVHVRDRLRLGNLVRFVRALSGSLPERTLLAARCAYCPVPLTLNGDRLDGGLARLRGELASWVEVADGDAFVAGGHGLDDAPGTVSVVAAGVTIRDVPLPTAPGFRAVAGSLKLRTDVSQADVVHDAAYADLLQLVERARLTSLMSLLADRPEAAEAALVRELLHAPPPPQWAADLGEDLAARLAGVPFWPRLAGPPLPTRALGDRPAYVTVPFTERFAALELVVEPPWTEVLLLPEAGVDAPKAGDAARLKAWFGDAVEDRTAALDRLLTAAENRRRYSRRFVDVRLPGEGWLGRVPVEGPEGSGITGEIGLRPAGGEAAVFFALAGRLLGERRAKVALGGLEVLLHGPFTPTELFDDLEQDAVFAAAVAAAAAAVPALVAEVLTRLPGEPAGAALARTWIAEGMLGDPVDRLRAALAGEPVVGAAPRAWLAALGQEGCEDPLARVALFSTSAGEPATFADLARWRADGAALRYVHPGRPPLAIEPPLLALDPAERAQVEAVFGPGALTSGEAAYVEAEARAAFFARPATAPTLDFDDATHLRDEPVAHGGFRGRVGLRMSPLRRRGDAWPLLVELWSGGRPVQVVSLDAPLPGLVAALEHPDFKTDFPCQAVLDPDLPGVLGAVLSVLPRLLAGDADPGGARLRLVRTLLDLIAPTATHREAWEALHAAHPAPEAEAAYLAILRAGWGGSVTTVAGALKAGGPLPVVQDPGALALAEAILGPGFLDPSGGAPPLARLMVRFPSLASVPIFETVEGEPVGLGRLRLATPDDPVLYASRPEARPEGYRGLLLRTHTTLIAHLRCLLGEAAVISSTAWSRTHALDRLWARLPPASPRLDPPSVVAVLPVAGGEVGLRSPFPADELSVVRIIVDGREVARVERRLSAAVEAAIAAEGLQVGMTSAGPKLGVDDRERIIAQVEAAIPAALAALADAMAGRMMPEARAEAWAHVLYALERLARGKARRPANLERDDLVRKLAEVKGFQVLGQGTTSLLALSRARAEGAALWLCDRATRPPVESAPVGEGLVVQVDARERDALKRLLGITLPEFAEVVDRVRREAAFMARPLSPVALTDVLVRVPVVGRDVQGLLGLAGAAGDRLVVHLRGRRLGVVPLRLGLPGLVAVVDAGEVDPDEQWAGPAEGPKLDRLRAVVAEAVPALLAEATRVAPDSPLLRSLAWALVRCAFPTPLWIDLHRTACAAQGEEAGEALYRDALRCLFQDAGMTLKRVVAPVGFSAPKLQLAEVGPRHGRGDALVRALFGNRWPLDGEAGRPALERLLAGAPALAEVPLVQTAAGERLSLRALVARAPAGLSYRLRPTPDTPADALLPEPAVWSLLEALFPGAWRDAAIAEIEARQARAIALIPPQDRLGPAPGTALAVVEVAGPGFRAEVGLGAPRSPGSLVVCRGLRPVATVEVPALPLIGGVEAPDEPLRFERDQPAGLVDAAGLVARVAAAAMPAVVAALVEAWPTLAGGALARAQRLALQLAREHPALAAVPVVETVGGEPRNLAELQALQADGRLRLATADAVAREGEVLALVAPDALPALEALVGKIPLGQPPPPPAPRAPLVPPGTRLLQRVRALLQDSLAPLELDRLRVGVEGARQPVRCGPDGVVIDQAHPLVARAMASEDPAWDALVAMVAFGEVNRWLEEVTDTHEAELIGRMAARLGG